MFLTLLIMVLSFVASKASGKSSKKSLATAALAGGATYLATQHTKVGADLSRSFDEMIGVTNTKPNDPARLPTTPTQVQTGVDADGKPIYTTVPVAGVSGSQGMTGGGNTNGTTSGVGIGGALAGMWNGLSPAGQVVSAAGTAVVAKSFLDKYGLWIIGGGLAFLLLKD